MSITQIRSSVFETNSSSMHSVVIAKTTPEEAPKYFTHNWNKDPIMKISEYELDWGRGPFSFLNSFEDKLTYLIPAVCYGNNKDNEFNNIMTAVKEILTENNFTEEIQIIMPKTKEYNYDKHEYEEKETTYYGTIDHQSSSILKEFLKKYNLSYKEFLENPKIQIVIDGDEFCYFYEMLNSKIIDENSIEIYPKEI